MAAVTKTLHAYERLMAVENPSALKEEWLKPWGQSYDRLRFRECRVCEAMPDLDCDGCPIILEYGACESDESGCDFIGSKHVLFMAFCSNNPIEPSDRNKAIKFAAKARYKELLRRLRKNGYVYR